VIVPQSLNTAPEFTKVQTPSRTWVPYSTSKGGWTMAGPRISPKSSRMASARAATSEGGIASSRALRAAQRARAAKKLSWAPS
jgi:hypothetical protein